MCLPTLDSNERAAAEPQLKPLPHVARRSPHRGAWYPTEPRLPLGVDEQAEALAICPCDSGPLQHKMRSRREQSIHSGSQGSRPLSLARPSLAGCLLFLPGRQEILEEHDLGLRSHRSTLRWKQHNPAAIRMDAHAYGGGQ